MQTPSAVLMIRPANFGYNEETSNSNSFQNVDNFFTISQIREKALQEFDTFAETLQKEGIEVIILDDKPSPPKPDSIFPNNWITFHDDGTVVLYPMLAVNRRSERRADLLVKIQVDYGYDITKIIDLSHYERENKFLEGTGSIVFDYINKIAYANISPRTSQEVLEDVANELDYKLITFNASDSNSNPIYHSNVILCIGEKFAIVCKDSIKSKKEKDTLLKSLTATGHEIIDISYEQVIQFAGNMIQLRDNLENQVIVMSENAYQSLSSGQLKALSAYAKIIKTDINTIEKTGGGSARCMLAGIFLPFAKKKNTEILISTHS